MQVVLLISNKEQTNLYHKYSVTTIPLFMCIFTWSTHLLIKLVLVINNMSRYVQRHTSLCLPCYDYHKSQSYIWLARRNQQKNMWTSIHRPFLTVSIVVSNGIPGLFQLNIVSSWPSFQQLDHSEPVPQLLPQAHSQVSDVKRNTMDQYFCEGIIPLIIKLHHRF